MTHVWIMRKKNRPSVGTSKSALVRADAITHLSMYESQVRASELGSDEVAVLVDTADGGHEAPPLPDDFHLTLLFAVSAAQCAGCHRRERRGSRPGRSAGRRELGLREFRPSEPEPEPS
ncbi:hypothetical protein QQM39_45555 [Streptomyces sp. DT2A-34]|uniref:hypothetical protein n=1 Tax=Streptomyces sp. DT2A-34 TaxID=3051182 RepID=UPI00265B95C6|nr:hypothetical protein [Streptomyces sp. DT2A-34]MDO0917796.1 hypothetical protein [Streptomyces sp. DT2A-34]